MKRPNARAGLLLLALPLLACGRKEPAPAQPEPTPAASAAPGASSAAGIGAPPATSATASPSARADEESEGPHLSPKEKAERAAKHKAAFARARGAVKAKDYKAAIDAYNEAHALLPHDAQTMGERGYTKFLAGDMTYALIDLGAAATFKGDAKILAQIWYNIGLVEEARKEPERARMAFSASVFLSPSIAAEDKLRGKSKCAASTTASGHQDQRVVKGWLGVWDALHKVDRATPRPKSEAAAKAAVCTEKSPTGSADENIDHCDEASPWSVAASAGNYEISDRLLVIPAEKGGQFFLLELGGFSGGACVSYFTVNHEVHPELVRAKYLGGSKYWITYTPPGGGDDVMECVASGSETSDVFYERATGKRLVAVQRTNDLAPPIEVKLLPDEGVVTVKGGGCNERLPLGLPAAPKK